MEITFKCVQWLSEACRDLLWQEAVNHHRSTWSILFVNVHGFPYSHRFLDWAPPLCLSVIFSCPVHSITTVSNLSDEGVGGHWVELSQPAPRNYSRFSRMESSVPTCRKETVASITLPLNCYLTCPSLVWLAFKNKDRGLYPLWFFVCWSGMSLRNYIEYGEKRTEWLRGLVNNICEDMHIE